MRILKIPRHVIAILVVLCYCLSSFLLLLLLLVQWNLHISDRVSFVMAGGWLLICGSAAYWYSPYTLTKMNIRYPTLREEAIVMLMVEHVQSAIEKIKTRRIADIDLRIQETEMGDAFVCGWRTLVLTKGLLEGLEYEECCAVIAHELGHLYHFDAVLSAAFFVPKHLHRFIFTVLLYVMNACRRCLRKLPWWIIALIAYIVLVRQIPWLALATTYIYYRLLPFFDRFFYYIWLVNMKRIEYDRDCFAYELGHGEALMTALWKLAAQSIDALPAGQSAHPSILHRIRRLEILRTRKASS